jgi:drug/metabolite transporter (DMT)-like permease
MRKAFAQLHIAVFLAGFTGILGRLITLNEGLLVWYRLLITVVTLWLLYYFRKQLVPVSLKEKLDIYFIGMIAAVHWITFYGSIKSSNVSVALVCFSSIGFFTALLEPLILKKKMHVTEIVLGLITILGILIIFHFDPEYKTGILLGIVSAILGSLFPIYNRRLLRRHDAETVTLHELTGGLLFVSIMLPLYLYFFPSTHLLPTLSDAAWLLVLAWFCTVLSFNLSMHALKKISAFTVNLTFNLEPVYGILLAFIVYQENKYLSGKFYLGLALILLSVILQSVFVYRAQRKKTGW